MKLFKVLQISALENRGIEQHCYTSLELMNRAAENFVDWILPHLKRSESIICLCGKGNNGADGLVIAEKLNLRGFDVSIYVANFSTNSSPEFDHHFARLKVLMNANIHLLETDGELPGFDDAVIIDALFGNGLSRPLTRHFASLVEAVNSAHAPVYAVDIPSGLHGDGLASGPAIKALKTCSFEFPKLCFFFKENAEYVGDWTFRSIGLASNHIAEADSGMTLITKSLVSKILKVRQKNTHKGDYGHVHLFVSSAGMSGAGILAARAALKSGCGLCSLSIPKMNLPILQISVPEAMVDNKNDEEGFSIPHDSKFTYGIGPGIGQSEGTRHIVRLFLKGENKPIVIDADALNIISLEEYLKEMIPKGSILTPHPREFERLAGSSANTRERLDRQVLFSIKHKVVLVVKDHYTTITTPEGKIYFNMNGNPGMATGGSGDVLTGIITSLLAQQYTPLDAALAGVYIHGRSADIYTASFEENSLTASDMIDCLPLAFKELRDLTS